MKRWVRGRRASYVPPLHPRCEGREADLEVLGIALADRTGAEVVDSLGLALECVRAYRDDFDEVFPLECGGRSLTALTGDLGAQMGLRLEGEPESNLARLRDFCSARRFLLLLADVGTTEPFDLIFGGRCSTLAVTEGGLEAGSDGLSQAQRAFSNIDPAASWAELCALAHQGRREARGQGRIAECFDLMQQWHATAELRGDRGVLDESAREMVWILESWDRQEEARRLEQRRAADIDEQLPLPFY